MINKTRDEIKQDILRRSSYGLPLRPSDSGMKPEEIKRAFWEWLLSSDGVSLFGELDRVVDETNAEFDLREDGMSEKITRLNELVLEADRQLAVIRSYDDLLISVEQLLREATSASVTAKEELDKAMQQLDNKLDKVTVPFSDGNICRKVYAVSPSGEQTQLDVATEPQEGCLALYREGGVLKTNMPSEDRHAVTKQYADDLAMQKYGEGFEAGGDILVKVADDSLETIYLGPTCRNISNNAFQYRKHLNTIYIDTDRMDGIYRCAFQACTALTVFRVLRPCSIGRIADMVFYGCKNLAEIDLTKCTNIPILNDITAFSGLPTGYVIRVPHALYYDWLAAENWSLLTDHIVQGGEHSFGEWIRKKEASCEEDSVDERVCSSCGHLETRTNDDAFTEHMFGEWSRKTEATCGEGSVDERVCARCGYTETRINDDAAEHEWSEWEWYSDADCENNGESVRYCTVCGATEWIVREYAYGHHYEDGVCSSCGATCHHVWGPTTSINDEQHESVCYICGATDISNHEFLNGDTHCHYCDYVKPCNHNWVLNSSEADGGHEMKCTACGAIRTEAHIYTDTYVAFEPTCSSEGQTIPMCSVCGHIGDLEGTILPIDPDAHRYGKAIQEGASVYQICELCGHVYSIAG